jgi:hypothetical protein
MGYDQGKPLPAWRPLVAVVLALAAAAAGVLTSSGCGATASAEPASSKVRTVAKVYGCKYEDSCRIDYRRDRQGRGVWVIQRTNH